MTTILFAIAQFTVVLAIANIFVRCLIARSPQLATAVCLLGITLVSIIIPVTLIPFPKFTIESWPIAPFASREVQSPEIPPQPTPLDSSVSMDSSVAAGGGINLRQLFSNLPLTASLELGEQPKPASICFFAWCLLAGMGWFRLALSVNALRRLRKQSGHYHNPQLESTLAAWARQHSRNLTFRLLLTDQVPSPCVAWIDRATIYLPSGFENWPEDEQLAVLAHEAAHVFRRDARWRFFFDLMGQWVNFHPLAWLLKRQLVLVQELAADQEAGHLLTSEKYRTGLCKLALRMDSQPQLSLFSVGVSLSTHSVIRRIKMLGSVKKPQLARWQQFVVVVVVAGMGLSVAFCTAGADEPTRVALRAAKPLAKPPVLFARHTSQPWDEVGVQSGFFRVLPSAAAQKPLVKQAINEATVELGIGDLDCGVSLTRDFVSWTSNLDFKIADLPLESRNSGHRFTLSINAYKPALYFDREVDWAEVAHKLPLSNLAGLTNVEALASLLEKQGHSKTLRMNLSDSSTYDEGDFTIAKSLWPLIDGGVTAAVFSLAEVAKIDPDYEPVPSSMAVCMQALSHCSFAGVGVDFADAASPCQVRLALVPNVENSAAKIQAQVELAIASVLDSMDDASDLPEAARLSQAAWRAELEAWQVRVQVIDGPIGEVVLIEGAVSDASLIFPLM
ncbi:M56 family metallopeptidase [Aureliella helgolandensis]|uniref:BlaR1 peptidase M56 n=1 Tax=Aureliella helgolandensis TaxID=2527968 RepID=A0A518GAW9_9BACT|nr:M56 family metallopeptidase [Aureliella helgolandensis]QDV25719.1 BlaR1 peptidase M56 [Aureliella helgolandensis]